MKVKKFNKETDYEEICEWWESWKLPVHPKEILSENGITISKNYIVFVVDPIEDLANQYSTSFGSGLVVPTGGSISGAGIPPLKLSE